MTELKRSYKEYIIDGSNFMFDGKFYFKKEGNEKFTQAEAEDEAQDNIQELDGHKD